MYCGVIWFLTLIYPEFSLLSVFHLSSLVVDIFGDLAEAIGCLNCSYHSKQNGSALQKLSTLKNIRVKMFFRDNLWRVIWNDQYCRKDASLFTVIAMRWYFQFKVSRSWCLRDVGTWSKTRLPGFGFNSTPFTSSRRAKQAVKRPLGVRPNGSTMTLKSRED